MKNKWCKLARQGAILVVAACCAIALTGCDGDDGGGEAEPTTYYFNWTETDGDYGEGILSITQTESTFSGTFTRIKFSNEGGTQTYEISGSRSGSSYTGTDSRNRTWTFQINGTVVSGSYSDPNGGEMGTISPK